MDVPFMHSFIGVLQERSRADNFMPVSYVGCFAPHWIQSEVQWLEALIRST